MKDIFIFALANSLQNKWVDYMCWIRERFSMSLCWWLRKFLLGSGWAAKPRSNLTRTLPFLPHWDSLSSQPHHQRTIFLPLVPWVLSYLRAGALQGRNGKSRGVGLPGHWTVQYGGARPWPWQRFKLLGVKGKNKQEERVKSAAWSVRDRHGSFYGAWVVQSTGRARHL